MLQIQQSRVIMAFLGLCCLLGGDSAQSEESRGAKPTLVATSASVSSVDRVDILKVVHVAYGAPTQKFLCSPGTSAIRATVKKRFSNIFSEEILNEFFSEVAQCGILASARFGFYPLDTPEAIRQTYSLKFAEPYTLHGATLVEVRFRPIYKGKPGEGEGGAIVYLKKQAGGWRIANIESVAYLGANGFQSLILDYPTLSSDAWSDVDYTKSLTRPERRH